MASQANEVAQVPLRQIKFPPRQIALLPRQMKLPPRQMKLLQKANEVATSRGQGVLELRLLIQATTILLFGCTSCGTFCVVPFFSLPICTDFREREKEGEKGAREGKTRKCTGYDSSIQPGVHSKKLMLCFLPARGAGALLKMSAKKQTADRPDTTSLEARRKRN